VVCEPACRPAETSCRRSRIGAIFGMHRIDHLLARKCSGCFCDSGRYRHRHHGCWSSRRQGLHSGSRDRDQP
jgi:hypothetical protein